MMYKTKGAVCSEIHRKSLTQSEHHVEFLNIKTVDTYTNLWVLKG
jgi:hypothetical protein